MGIYDINNMWELQIELYQKLPDHKYISAREKSPISTDI